MVNYYSWFSLYSSWGVSYYINDILVWEDSSFLLSIDTFFYLSVYFSIFLNNYISIFNQSFFSLFDFVILNNSLLYNINSIYIYLFLDLYLYLSIIYLKFFFIINSFDNLFIFFTLNIESLFIYNIFFNYLNTFIIETDIFILYDVFGLNIFFSYCNFYIYFKWLILSLLFLITVLHVVRFNKFGLFLYLFFLRFYFFSLSLAFENRIQFDLLYLFGFLVFFVWLIILISYDDVFIDIVELNHLFYIYYFIFIILYLLYRYSLHYFAFLENSVSDGFTSLFIIKQFVRDISNSFALFLRFFLLLFRLNIYDGLDDFLDSYYIFFIDFDEDSYLDELFCYSLNFWFFFNDNNEDLMFYQLTEFEWFDDLFSKYFIIWGKIFMFWGFILEEAFRISLAFYIFYLIIFEVHAVNNSYNETNVFDIKLKN